MMDNPVTLTVQLSAEAVKRLEEMAQQQQQPLVEFVQATLESVALEEDEEEYEDSDEEILAGLRESLEDMKAGRMRPIEELFDEILKEQNDGY